jgi:5'-3' exonuclease
MSTNAVYGFTNFMLDILRQKNPTYILCAFDESLETGFRHQLAPDYKANRELPDEALAFQLNACRQVCRVLGVTEIASKIYEADDLIGSMAKIAGNADIQPIIVSKDKDLMQLIGNNELYWDFGRSQPQAQKELERTLELGCYQMADYLALVGDASDNIAGIAGIGKKTAKQLLSHFSDIESILEHLDQLEGLPIRGAKKLADRFAGNQDQLVLSKLLATIETDIKDMPDIEHIKWRGVQEQAFELFTEEMGFGSTFSSRLADLKKRQLGSGMGIN